MDVSQWRWFMPDEIGNNVPQVGVPLTGQVVFGQPSSTTETASVGISTKSTLQPSMQEQVLNSIEAGFPTIPLPLLQLFIEQPAFNPSVKSSGSIGGVSAAEIWALGKGQIILDMLIKWNESIKEDIKKRAEIENNPNEIRRNEERLAELNATSSVLSAASHIAASSPSGAAAVSPSQSDPIPLLALGLVFTGVGGVQVTQFVDTVSTHMVGIMPTKDQAPFLAVYTSDMRAELGLLGAALLQGASYMAVAQSVVKTGGGAPVDPEVTAKNYAEEILKLIGSGQLTNLVSALMTAKSAEGKPVDKALTLQLVKVLDAQLKIILLSTALAGLYKSEKEGGTGWITSEDYLGLLSGENETFRAA